MDGNDVCEGDAASFRRKRREQIYRNRDKRGQKPGLISGARRAREATSAVVALILRGRVLAFVAEAVLMADGEALCVEDDPGDCGGGKRGFDEC